MHRLIAGIASIFFWFLTFVFFAAPPTVPTGTPPVYIFTLFFAGISAVFIFIKSSAVGLHK